MANTINEYYSGALYYPRISMTDPYLFKSLALLHDRVYRIVPDGIIPEDDENLQPLIEAGYLGKMIDPIPYSKSASDIFLEKMSGWDAAALSLSDDDIDLARIHKDKTDEKIRSLFHDLGYTEHGDWHHIPTELASNYMLFLATEIAKSNRLGLVTDEIAPWTAVNYFHMDGMVDDMAFCGRSEEAPDGGPSHLYNLVVENLLPANIADIPAHLIVNFREKRGDEVTNLRATISDLYDELTGINERDIQMDIINARVKSLDSACEDFRKSAESIKAEKWFGATTWSFPAIGFLGTLLGIVPLSTSILSASCAAVGMIVNLTSTRRETINLLKESSASGYIAFHKDFGRYCSPTRNINNISAYAWNSMEEYIND